MTTRIQDINFNKVAKAFKTLGKAMKELEKTVLRGWPYDKLPTPEEAHSIASAHKELRLHLPTLSNKQAWEIAGNIVARIKRDKESA